MQQNVYMNGRIWIKNMVSNVSYKQYVGPNRLVEYLSFIRGNKCCTVLLVAIDMTETKTKQVMKRTTKTLSRCNNWQRTNINDKVYDD